MQLTSEEQLAFYLKGWFDAAADRNFHERELKKLLKVINSVDNCVFARHLEAVAANPDAMIAIVDSYFKKPIQEPSGPGFFGSIKSSFNSLFKG